MAELGAILTAMVTPFDAEGGVDHAGAAHLASHLVAHGSEGLVIAGSTGESATLSDQEQLDLIATVVHELAGGPASVVAGTGSNDTRHACELTARAVELGVDAVLSVCPYYNKPNRRGLLRHFTEVARAAAGVPVLVYNIPSRTVIDMPNDLLAELGQVEGIEGVKQANSDNVALIDGLDVYSGNDDLLCEVLEIGGAGGICVASHLVGESMARMVAEPLKRQAIDAELHPLYDALAVTTNPIPLKAGLAMVGLPAGGLRLPLVEADDAEREVVRAALDALGLLAGAPVHR